MELINLDAIDNDPDFFIYGGKRYEVVPITLDIQKEYFRLINESDSFTNYEDIADKFNAFWEKIVTGAAEDKIFLKMSAKHRNKILAELRSVVLGVEKEATPEAEKK